MKKAFVLFSALLVTSIVMSQNSRSVIENVTFINNEKINKNKLITQIELKPPSALRFNSVDFDRRLLKLDAINLKNYYNANGFLEAAVKDSFHTANGMVDIFFIINEGKQYFLKDVKINGLESINQDQVLKRLSLNLGEPHNPVKINTNLSNLYGMLEEKGKIFSVVDVKQVINDSVEVELNIEEGKKAHINQTWISGVERIDSLYVKNEITFKPGEVFNKKQIEKTKRNLLEVGFFSSVNIVAHPVVNVDSLVDLEVRVREFKNVGEVSLEYGLDEIETVPGVRSLIGLGGSINWTDRMILGTKNRFETDGTVVLPTEEGFIFPRFGIDLKISNQRPLSFKIPTEIKVFFQQFKNFGDEYGPYVRRLGFQYSNIFRWNRQRSFLDIGLTFERFDESEALKEDIEQRKLKVHLNQDNRDNPLNPREGYVLIAQFDSYGGQLGGNRTYIKYNLDLRNYYTLLDLLTFAVRINAGLISGWSSDYDQYESILFEKFYLGGSNTLRAVKPLRLLTNGNDQIDNDGNGLIDADDENESNDIPSGDIAMLLTNWEIRFPMPWRLGGVIFADGGNISNDFRSLNTNELVWNYGFALTLNLPVGPIRIDYAQDSKDASINQIQLGFLYAF